MDLLAICKDKNKTIIHLDKTLDDIYSIIILVLI